MYGYYFFASFHASGTIPVCITMFDQMRIGIQTEALILLSNFVFMLSCPKLVCLGEPGYYKIYRARPIGLVRDLNPGPRAPEARIIPLDQRADISIKNLFL